MRSSSPGAAFWSKGWNRPEISIYLDFGIGNLGLWNQELPTLWLALLFDFHRITITQVLKSSLISSMRDLYRICLNSI